MGHRASNAARNCHHISACMCGAGGGSVIFNSLTLVCEMANVCPELADTEEAAAGGMD